MKGDSQGQDNERIVLSQEGSGFTERREEERDSRVYNEARKRKEERKEMDQKETPNEVPFLFSHLLSNHFSGVVVGSFL